MGNLYLLPSKQGWENGAVSSMIWNGSGGWGEVGFAVSFFMILSKIVAPWGLPINLRIFWLKISMPGSADEISQNNR